MDKDSAEKVPDFKSLTCLQGNIAKFMCTNSKCQDPTFVCLKDECHNCKKSHKQCKLIGVRHIFGQLHSKARRLSPQVKMGMKALENVYDEAIDKLMDDKEQSYMKMEFFGLNKFEAEFMKMAQEGRQSEITGSKTCNLYASLFTVNNFEATSQSILKRWQRLKPQFEQTLQRLKRTKNIKYLDINSRVTQDTELLNEFFDQNNDTVGSFELLYRASENGFSAAQFHRKCDKKKNTLVLVETEFGKVIGGFTNLQWGRHGNYRADQSKKTFIFSVTLRERYSLINPVQAIFCQEGYGPTFGGGHDIYLANGPHNNRGARNQDEYNQQDDQQQHQPSYFNFPNSFAKQDSILGIGATTETYESFSGQSNGDMYCGVKQYEVFQVNFI